MAELLLKKKNQDTLFIKINNKKNNGTTITIQQHKEKKYNGS